MLQKEQRYLKMSDGKDLYTYIWSDTDVVPEKAIVLCHGMAEHIDRYDSFAKVLVNNGFIVFGYNQRGHRFTDEKENYGYMGDCDNFDILVSDLNEVIDYVKVKKPNIAVYLFGHSMGSFVSTRFIELFKDKISGVVLCGTGRNPNLILNLGAFIASIIRVFRGKKHRSKLINAMAFGAFNKKFAPNRTEFDWLNTNNDEVDKYINDEWCGGIFTLAYYHDFFKGCIKVTKDLNSIRKDLPILLIAGDKDPVGNMGKGVIAVFNDLVKLKKDVQIKLIDGARHEILLEDKKEEVMQTILNFLK